LRVAYGRPVDTADLAHHDRAEASRIATERLRTAISDLERLIGPTPTEAA
jgi:hypothetical protein